MMNDTRCPARLTAGQIGGHDQRVSSVEPVYAELGRRLQEERERRGVTQAAVAERVDLPRSAISNIEKGRQRTFVHVLLAYAELLQLDPGKLLRDLALATPMPVTLENVASSKPLEASEVDFIRNLVQRGSGGDP